MITLNRAPEQHNNKAPVLVFWDGTRAVFVAESVVLKRGIEPVSFANNTQASAVAAAISAPCVIKNRTEVRAAGRLIGLTPTAIADVRPTPKTASATP
jgi:hypothetical protein